MTAPGLAAALHAGARTPAQHGAVALLLLADVHAEPWLTSYLYPTGAGTGVDWPALLAHGLHGHLPPLAQGELALVLAAAGYACGRLHSAVSAMSVDQRRILCRILTAPDGRAAARAELAGHVVELAGGDGVPW